MAINERQISASDKWIVDTATGAIVGVQNPSASGTNFFPPSITISPTTNLVTAVTNGATRAFSRITLAQSGAAIILPSSGTVATNGTITVAALPITYSQGAWIRLPAGAVVGGSAGLYWCVFSSTTAGQVYTNFADASTPFAGYVPTGTLVAAVGSNSAYTQSTADITLANITIPANAMGDTGSIIFNSLVGLNNDASSKIQRLKFGGTDVFAGAIPSLGGYSLYKQVKNVTSSIQISSPTGVGSIGGQISASLKTAINTTADVSVLITGSIATVATDGFVLDSFLLELLPS